MTHEERDLLIAAFVRELAALARTAAIAEVRAALLEEQNQTLKDQIAMLASRAAVPSAPLVADGIDGATKPRAVH